VGNGYDVEWVMVWDLHDGKVVKFEEAIDSAPILAALA
jgi:hypothetical protein